MKDKNFLIENGINVEHGLELLGDMEMYNETLNDFLTESESRIEQMNKYKDDGDLQNYAILAHSMKSDSKYLGFSRLAELSLEHELKGKDNDIDFIVKNYDALINEANRVINVIHEYLGD